jgi:hypothetical protein
MYTYHIPAMHMFAWVIISLSSYAWVYGVISFTVENYLTLVGQAIVLVIELRVRKNEVGRYDNLDRLARAIVITITSIYDFSCMFILICGDRVTL